ncbi:hypothetical protein ACYAYC_13075 [Klebsiella pneumoniae]|uniref:hypothetical protein n=1 Tax=Klebsiella TaxID=570 RepID=UPI0013EF2716|nr:MULTISPECIES: hypothetical protein [Klebsiella]QXW38588.1 hypothetical protein KXJ78_21330 [Klebsiella grimontii]HDT1825779.1 hypothetical protein [Klebsiella quasipneumoniae subsp. similipneumoniae]HBQ3942795.1 hypothetical protein [Klebsiella pneumoniae]HBR2016229.1 hypothetical protein [Klebsiella pneumoniae]HBR4888770.1 hypothetical protein [Klebsiella pneumoniae]
MIQLFNEYGQKVSCNLLMTLHPSLIKKLEKLSEQIGQGVVSEDQRLTLAIGEMLRRLE